MRMRDHVAEHLGGARMAILRDPRAVLGLQDAAAGDRAGWRRGTRPRVHEPGPVKLPEPTLRRRRAAPANSARRPA